MHLAKSGARLLRSHRVRLPSAENGNPHGGNIDGGSGDVCSPSKKGSSRNENGMAWLESPCGAVRVLLVDDRLLSFSVQCSESSSNSEDDDLSGFYSPCEEATDGEMGIRWSTASGGNSVGVASGPEHEWRSSPSTLLLGIAAMVGLSSDDAIAPDGPECERDSAGQCLSGRQRSSIRSGVNEELRIGVSSRSDGRGEGKGVARNGPGGVAKSQILDVEGQSRSSVGRRRSESGDVPKGRGVFESGERKEGATEGVVDGEACLDKGSEDRSHPLAKGWRSSERPFPTLEVTMLGNLGGSLRVVPNRYLCGASPAE